MNQTIQNFTLTLTVLLIFMFGYFHINPKIPADKLVSIKAYFVSDLQEWAFLKSCEDGSNYNLSSEASFELNRKYESLSVDAWQPVYFEFEGRMVHSVFNELELTTELHVEKINMVSITPIENCEAFNTALTSR